MLLKLFINVNLAHLEGLFEILQLDEELEQKVDVLVSDVGGVLHGRLIEVDDNDTSMELKSSLRD